MSIGVRGRPLFLRIFGLMLLTLLLVQALNFALVMLVPPPLPTINTLTNIAAALRGQGDGGGTLRVSPGEVQPDAEMHPREVRVRALLARRLGLPESEVHIRSAGPAPRGPPMLFGPEEERRRMHFFHEGHPDEFLFGDFAVSARLDGQWRTVRPVSTGFEPWRWRAMLWLVIAIAVVAPLAWLLARGLARPIRLFATAAERLGRDPKAPPLELAGPPEIRDAAAAFNEMQARLNRYVEDRTTLMAAIAHDLRTPLMRLGLRLEDAPAELRDACEADIRDMEAMIAAVMAFVRDMAKPARRQRLDLRALAESVTDGFADAGGAVALEPGEAVILEGDAPALKAMLSNLVGNALQYAGSAEVALAIVDGCAEILVRDDGPGMSAEDLAHAFEPFFRGERSRSRETGGIGLGLASARAVARAHGGEVTLANRPEKGLVARVTLPL